MTPLFRLLLVGLGNRGTMWSEVIHSTPGAALAGAMDIDSQRRDTFKARYPDVPLFAALDEALSAEPYDAVVLVTPPDGHLEQAGLIFGAGLPLLAEKPLALDLAEAAAIVRLATEKGLPLSVCLNFRYLPVSQMKRDLVRSGRFGRPGMGQFVYQRSRDGMRPGLNRYPLTMRHPMMLEQSVHHLDLIRYCYDREVISIACRTWNPPWSMYAHDSSVQCLLALEGDLEVSYVGTWTSGWNEPHFLWRTDCSDGVILQRELFSDIATAHRNDSQATSVPIAEARAYYDDTALLLEDFIAACRNGDPVPCDGRDHLRTLALCFAGIESSERSIVVAMDEFCERHGIAPSP